MTKEETFKIDGVEVFTTKMLESHFPKLKINFDLNETVMPYPCGHTILRVEGNTINSEKIIAIIKKSGFMCDILEDKVCS